MDVQFTVVVSSENSHYMAWQTQLFCFSAITRLNKRPIIIVHDTSQPLRPEFRVLSRLGCRVIPAPPFKLAARRRLYAARNEIGSLLWLTKLGSLGADNILFCEPDMLFLGPLEFRPGASAEHYEYLDYGERRVEAVARKMSLQLGVEDLNARYSIGVPYLLPCSDLQRLAARWLALIDCFEELDWIDIMYAFGFAAATERIAFRINGMMITNKEEFAPVAERRIIHYPYGSDLWNKRTYMHPPGPIGFPPSRLPAAPEKTVLGEIVSQIAEAREFFGYRNPLRRALDRFGLCSRSYPLASQALWGSRCCDGQ